MFIFKIKREQAQFTAKNSAQTVHVYIFHNLSIYSCSAEERELKNMLKDIKKYKHKIQIKNNTLLINKLLINKPHTLQKTCIRDTDTKNDTYSLARTLPIRIDLVNIFLILYQ